MAQFFGKPDTDPVMHVGKYQGTRVSQLPLSYCRWIIMQKFPADIVAAAKKKVDSSAFSTLGINVSRHALDMFSLRFLDYWFESEARECGKGLGTFVAEYAERAWDEGKDVSKHRHQDDGLVKELDGIRFVYQVSPTFPEHKDVITCYPVVGTKRWKPGDQDAYREA